MCNIKRLFLDSQLSVYSPISNFLFSIYQVFKEAISRYLREHGYDNIRLKAVLFDMDGVLFNSMPYHADAWHTVMERHGLHLSREEAYMHAVSYTHLTPNADSLAARGIQFMNAWSCLLYTS